MGGGGRRVAAWAVHAYTALGLPLALWASVALYRGELRTFFLASCAAVFVDATDGFLARAVRVKEVLPEFDGRRLDDIVDFITFVFLPALAIVRFGLFPEGWEAAATLPLLASAYGFCQDRAKTDESFVGFPSYWNIGVLYLVALGTGLWTNLAIIALFAALVFVPVHYVYPSRTRMLRPVTISLGYVWGVLMIVLSLDVTAAWARTLALGSLFYPAYYFALSGLNHLRIAREQ
jgi:phosphatidylcholine synthase